MNTSSNMDKAGLSWRVLLYVYVYLYVMDSQ